MSRGGGWYYSAVNFCSQLYGSQLARGDDYSQLHPTISICFVNGRRFPERSTYHRRFRLFDPSDPLLLTEDLDMHLLELFNFERALEELRNRLDFWLYFLKNGVALDADALPTPLDTQELRQAMEVLKMFSQDEMARELYEVRLRAERDAKMREREVNQARAQLVESQQLRAEAQELQADAQQRDAEAERETLQELAHRIRSCERLVGRPVTDTTERLPRGAQGLRALADQLERQLPSRVS